MNEETIISDLNFRLLLIVFCKQFGPTSPDIFDVVAKDLREDYIQYLMGEESTSSRSFAKMSGIDYGENINQLLNTYDKLVNVMRVSVSNILEGFQEGN